MRIRRKPWARPELEACPFFICDPRALCGKWSSSFQNPALPLFLELGCGKGGWIAQMAAHTPDANFLAVDIKNEMLALCKRAADRAYAEAGRDPSNLRITAADIEHIDTVLAPPDHVAQLHIQFPNPWPKPSHRKRRLTHTRQLQLYRPFLDADSRIFIKTDDAPLYHDTLRYLGEAGFEIISATDDLYRDGVPNGALLTEHERMFLADGLKICSIEARMI